MIADELIRVANNTWARVFDETVAKYPKKEALVFKDKRVTYEQSQDEVNRLAKGLLKIGVKKDDKVAVWMTNNLEYVYSLFAILKIGATEVPIGSRYKAGEVSYFLHHSDVTTLILKDNFLGRIDALEMIKELIPELSSCQPGGLESGKFPMLRNIICLGRKGLNGVYSFDEVMELGDDCALDDQLAKATASGNPDDIAVHMYTSGTTGLPKAVMNTHRGFLARYYTLNWHLGVTVNDRILGALPFTGGMGTEQIVGSVIAGATLVIMESFDAEEALKLIERERVTAGSPLVPSMFRMMLDHPNFSRYDVSSFKGAVIAGMPATPDLIRDMWSKMGMETVLNLYGLQESYGSATSCRAGDSLEQLTATVGYPDVHCLIKITDINTGEELPAGRDGEICIKEAIPEIKLTAGYYKMPEKTAEAIDKDGWLHSGDVGRIREKDGYLEITGRVKDMILVGGYNVYPAEIEAMLVTHPKVSMAAVVGVPDRRLGELPVAFIILREGEECSENEIIDFCKDKVANIKVPRYVKFVTEFPRTLQEKVQKFKLREIAIKELGL